MEFASFLAVARELQRPKGIPVNCQGPCLLVAGVQGNLPIVTCKIQGLELLGPSQHIQCVISSW